MQLTTQAATQSLEDQLKAFKIINEVVIPQAATQS